MDSKMSEEGETKFENYEESGVQTRPKRRRKQQVKEEKEREGNYYRRWTEEEKRLLLLGLETHGPRDLIKIAEVVGTRSKQEVMCAIKYWKTEAMKVNMENIVNSKKHGFKRRKSGQKRISNKCSKSVDGIELWIDVMIKQLKKIGKDGLSCVSPTVKMIAQFEALPTVEEADGIDFRELYLWLAEILAGQPMRNLSVPTSAFLTQCTRDFDKLTIESTWPKTKAAIERIVDKKWCPLNARSYARSQEENSDSDIINRMQTVLNVPGINTVGLDLERLINKQYK